MKSGAGLVELRDSGHLLEERAGGIKNSLRNSLFVREINNQGGCSATPWHTELQLRINKLGPRVHCTVIQGVRLHLCN